MIGSYDSGNGRERFFVDGGKGTGIGDAKRAKLALEHLDRVPFFPPFLLRNGTVIIGISERVLLHAIGHELDERRLRIFAHGFKFLFYAPAHLENIIAVDSTASHPVACGMIGKAARRRQKRTWSRDRILVRFAYPEDRQAQERGEVHRAMERAARCGAVAEHAHAYAIGPGALERKPPAESKTEMRAQRIGKGGEPLVKELPGVGRGKTMEKSIRVFLEPHVSAHDIGNDTIVERQEKQIPFRGSRAHADPARLLPVTGVDRPLQLILLRKADKPPFEHPGTNHVFIEPKAELRFAEQPQTVPEHCGTWYVHSPNHAASRHSASAFASWNTIFHPSPPRRKWSVSSAANRVFQSPLRNMKYVPLAEARVLWGSNFSRTSSKYAPRTMRIPRAKDPEA